MISKRHKKFDFFIGYAIMFILQNVLTFNVPQSVFLKIKVTKDPVIDRFCKKWYNKNGKLHRNDAPAIIHANGDQEWYKNNQRHRKDGPAVEFANGNQAWYKNNKRHRDDGPAIICASGYQAWFKNDQPHRDDGPAVIGVGGIRIWYKDGIMQK